jgi:type I restriction enzyme, S subunit
MADGGWPTVAIGELVEPIKTWNPSRAPSDDIFNYIDLSAVDQDTKRIIGARQVSCYEAPSRARQLVIYGDVLVSTVRPNLNSVARVPVELDGATASTGFCVLRPRALKLDGNYLFHWTKTTLFLTNMSNKATGANYPAVSDRAVFDSQIPLPSLAEQKRTAAILDAAEALREKRRQSLAKLDTLIQALFLDLFGDPIETPRRFKVKPLIEIVDPARPISYGILMPGPDQKVGVAYVRVVDMREGGIDLASVRKTTPEISNEFRRSLLKPGDILLSIRGHVGRLAIVPTELDGANITQDTARLAIKDAEAVFVRECLRAPGFQRWMTKHTKGAAVRGINLGDVKLIPITLPPLPLQREFAAQVSAVERLKTAQRASLAKLDALFGSLQHRAFRGEL